MLCSVEQRAFFDSPGINRSAFCDYRKGAERIEAFIRLFELDNSTVLISWETLKVTQWMKYYNHIWKYITVRQVNLTLLMMKFIILHKFQVKKNMQWMKQQNFCQPPAWSSCSLIHR